MKGSINPLAVSFEGGSACILYESQTTRVVRQVENGAAVVTKEHLGHGAKQRLAHERDMLMRLAGVQGVALLASGAPLDGVMTLQDQGGMTLAQLLDTGPIDADHLLALTVHLTLTLAEIHRAGIIHRDINPSNILLCESHQTVLIDFDLAMPTGQLSSGTSQDGIVGTLAYLAPEQSGRTGRAADQRSDLYALGATMYEMATGRVPFDAQDTLQLIHEHMVREPTAPALVQPGVPRGLSDIILRLLAKAPEQRYQSADGLLHDLKRLRSSIGQGDGQDEPVVFKLGERDFPARLAPPSVLVGRDAECVLLKNALADALTAPRRALLIEGVAGVGKSALINELRPLVAAAGGWFVQGKFDQYQRASAAAGAVIQAFAAFGRLLLALPKDELSVISQRLLERLGRNAGILTRMAPEFALVLGEQPAVQEHDPRQAELLVHQTTLDMLAVTVSAGRPLVIVLDDLQWAGAISLRAFERLMFEMPLRGVLVVGAWRSDEVHADNVLASALDRWRQHPMAPTELLLANLSNAGACELLGQMLRLEATRAGQLGLAVAGLTGGNPFDTVEMINALRGEGVLNLSAHGWQWDESAVVHFVGQSSVADLLTARIAPLPETARGLLEIISCLGSQVAASLLAAAAGLQAHELHACMGVLLEDGLLVQEHASGLVSIRWGHDRVQQAVMSSMDDTRRSRCHLEIARRLAPIAPRGIDTPSGFNSEAAEQYLACIAELDEPEEMQHVATLFLGLARVLAARAMYLLADRYLTASGSLLDARIALTGESIGQGATALSGRQTLRMAIATGRHAALYTLGRLEESDIFFAELRSGTANPLELVEPTCLQMRSLDMRGRMDSAMNLGLAILMQLGLAVPADYMDPNIEQRLDALDDWITRDGQMDTASRPQITDLRLLGIAKLLGRTVRSAVVCFDAKVIVWLLLESQRMWDEYGPCPELVASLGRMSSMLISRRQDYHGAWRIARHVLMVGEALGYEPQTSEARFIYGTYASHWFEPLEETYRQVRRAYEGVQAEGDISYAPSMHVVLITAFWELTASLEMAEVALEKGIGLCTRTGNVHAAMPHILIRQTLRALRGQTLADGSFDDAEFNEEAFIARAGKLPYIEQSHNECRAIYALVMGDSARLGRAMSGTVTQLGNFSGYYLTAHLHFFTAVARAWRLQAEAPSAFSQDENPLSQSLSNARVLGELDASLDWLAARAADQPGNYLHLVRLVQAERAWALGELWQAAAHFDSAMIEAESRKRPWHRALIIERAGRFQLARKLTHAARLNLTEARDHYAAWGATAKVAQMELEYEFLRSTGEIQQVTPELQREASGGPRTAISNTRSSRGSSNVSSEALDLMGVLRASQALSSETGLEQLTARVTEVVAVLSGATRVLVLSWSEQQWWLLAPAPGQAAVPVTVAATRGLLPLSAFAYVERTGEALVVDDALCDDRFSRDTYFTGVPLCSLMVAPIVGQGAARAMLVLENRLGSSAFNAQRLDAVMLIAGQLAVSLANAQLYEGLEQRVQARTRELESAQAQLVTTARQAGRAEIANNVLHSVGNVLNSINVSASVVRRSISESRAEGLGRAVELMNELERQQPQFMGGDPRGKVLLGYLNQLVGELHAERQIALGDLDRLSRSVDHITYVVATQQSHAGPSSVVEAVRPHELLDEALRLSEQSLASRGVTVVRRYAEVPAIELDGQRLLQILVNLIANAAQAMEAVPEGSRRLTVAIDIILHGGDGGADRRLRISVQDEGDGIEAENLTRIFSHGFTTRKDGHGFGLHSSALATTEMGGRLFASSDGPGHGATFTLELPLQGGGATHEKRKPSGGGSSP